MTPRRVAGAQATMARWVRRGLGMLRRRWRLWSARRRLEVARYWQARADLDEAARHAGHALRLLPGAGSALVCNSLGTLLHE